jgi:beta-glucanase (GH16 family)
MISRAFDRVIAIALAVATADATKLIKTRSGLRPWVDADTPEHANTVTTSRGDTWDLVMSDEFNVEGRSFAPGNDHLWTAIEMPDGVNAALEYYSINMSSTVTESDGRGVFQIEVTEESDGINYTAYNSWSHPPKYEDHTMYYRAAMVQSWNTFCFQGGRMEVSAQLPGAITSASGNPDLGNDNVRVETTKFYPTWPGIWLLGNLGRALFTGTTSRMWPWSFSECDERYKDDQRISACDSSPGHGLNPNQGRGAPEIDLLEGGGTAISTSIQLAPGMPDKFRMISPGDDDSNVYCFYSGSCETLGANYPGIPTATYETRGYDSWYQGLRYAPNTLCSSESDQIQSATSVKLSMKSGVTSNSCSGTNTCPASKDGYSDLDLIDGNGTRYWGINDVGGCMPVINGYMGAYLCDSDNNNTKCASPLSAGATKSNSMDSFNYQMDAISANWGVQLGVYTDYVTYQLEWVMGSSGYIRWMIEDVVVFEIPAETIENPPQDDGKTNPKKLMIEEPMYIIFNVALSTSWGTSPPNAGSTCRGDGSDDTTNKICDAFPMYMKIDYIRIYQDLSEGSTMAIGCDPETHPTAQFIEDNIDDYTNADNKWIEVVGGANCHSSDDCTVGTSHILTGMCSSGKCKCLSAGAWSGPRCTMPTSNKSTATGYGPSLVAAFIVAGVGLLGNLLGTVRILSAHSVSRKVVSKDVIQQQGGLSVDEGSSYVSLSVQRRRGQTLGSK